jgi:nucleoid-associated protein YgaU
MHNRWQPLVVMALALSAFSFHNNSAAEQSATTTSTTTTTIQPPTTTEPTPTTSTTDPPSEPGPDEPTPEAGQETSREVVVAGDTLWTIAQDHLAAGSGEPTTQEVAEYVAQVAKANRGRLQSGDPDLIYPGEEIILPPVADRARPSPEARRDTHDVAEGDNLWSIARDHLAEVRGGGADEPTLREVASYWLRVIEANRDRLASGDPDLIYPGEQIALPPVD